ATPFKFSAVVLQYNLSHVLVPIGMVHIAQGKYESSRIVNKRQTYLHDIMTQSITWAWRIIAVNKRSYFRDLLPVWQMPSDAVKAVGWFMHWLLKVLVHFFWIPILGMVIYETVSGWRFDGAWNGVTSGVITLLVGLIVWAILYTLLIFA